MSSPSITSPWSQRMVSSSPSSGRRARKTTTLNLVAGLIEITDGEIYIGDKQINDLDPKDRIWRRLPELRPLPQQERFETRVPPQDARGIPSATRSRLASTRPPNLLSIGHLLARRQGASGGQQQRVALGRALVRNPQGLPDGRAALQPGRETACPDAGRAQALPPGTPGRPSSTSLTTRWKPSPWPTRWPSCTTASSSKDGPAGRDLRPPRQPVRGRVRRQPADEPDPRGAHHLNDRPPSRGRRLALRPLRR